MPLGSSLTVFALEDLEANARTLLLGSYQRKQLECLQEQANQKVKEDYGGFKMLKSEAPWRSRRG